MTDVEARLRIGELSRRTGVGPDSLRAWERRYGLVHPVRTPGGFRLYSAEDEIRVRDMQVQLARGLSAAEAARAVLAARGPAAAAAPLDDQRDLLAEALAGFDGKAAHALLDGLFAVHGADVAMREVIYPYLRDLGEAWERSEVDVGQEHFASNLLQGRLLGLVPDWGLNGGPHAVLACPSGEQHSLGLAGLGVSLRGRGWRVTYLGADTPLAIVADTAATLTPRVVVLSSTMASTAPRFEQELRELARSARLFLAGAAFGQVLADRVGAKFLDADPVTAAERLAAD